MAIGNSQLMVLDNDTKDISLIATQRMRNSWNTFQYVSKNLRAWADETTIGTDIVNNLIAISDELEHALDNMDAFLKTVDKYIQTQRAANGETAWWK